MAKESILHSNYVYVLFIKIINIVYIVYNIQVKELIRNIAEWRKESEQYDLVNYCNPIIRIIITAAIFSVDVDNLSNHVNLVFLSLTFSLNLFFPLLIVVLSTTTKKIILIECVSTQILRPNF